MKSRPNRQALLWGSLLILFGVISLVEISVDLGTWIWVGILVAAGLAGLLFYLAEPLSWALLIPSYVFWAVAGLVVTTELDLLRDPWIAFYVLAAIALPFLITFLRARQQWWALIPAYVLLAIALMIVLQGSVLTDLMVPAYVMFAIALPFLVIVIRDRQHWWALIPGGITAIIGLAFLFAGAAVEYITPVALILIGLGILARQLFFRGRRGAAGKGDGHPAT